MRLWIGFGLVALLAGAPAAHAKRTLHGEFVAQPVDGVVESYRFHRDYTYEWMREFDGRRYFACGRYHLEGPMIVLLEDPKGLSCKNGKVGAPGPLVERWVPADTLKAVKLGGERFSRAAPATHHATLTS